MNRSVHAPSTASHHRSPVELSVVIPAHNSGALIDLTVGRLANRLSGRAVEIIVVENGSTDDTLQRCERLSSRWDNPTVSLRVLRSNRGMGNALRTGALNSEGQSVLLTADDLPFGFDDLDGAEAIAAAHRAPTPPMIIGSKAHRESRVSRGAVRGVLTWVYRGLRRLILGMTTGDPQGTLIVDGDLLRRLAPHMLEPGYLFTTELVYVVERIGIRPAEVPVRLEAHHGMHQSRVTVRDAVTMAVGVLKLRRRHHERSKWASILAGWPVSMG